MDARIWFCLAMALLSLEAFSPTEGCSCYSKHLQRSFCNADVALQAKFLNATYTDTSNEFYGNYSLITYAIGMQQVFKGDAALQNLKFIYSSTEYYCEMYIRPSEYNKEYLITGPIRDGRVEVIYCDYVVPWRELSAQQIKGIQGAYTRGCACNIMSCESENCSGATSKDCHFYANQPPMTSPAPEGPVMSVEHHMCAQDENGVCTWQSIV